MEKRAVRISHELWKQIMTQGYTSGGICCVAGLPEDAQYVGAFYTDSKVPDPVFMFESESWPDDLAFKAYSVKSPDGDVMPLMDVMFRTTVYDAKADDD